MKADKKVTLPVDICRMGITVTGDRKNGRKIHIDEDKAVIVRKIFEDYVAGRLVTDIIDEVHEKGIKNRGKPFARNTVYNLLKNEKYAGIFRHGDEVFTNIYPAIISQTTYEIVRAKIASNKYGKHKPEIEYLLKYKVICGYCEKPVNSDSGTSKNGTIMRYYKCAGKRIDKSCPHTPIRKEVLEQVVIDATYQALASPELIEDIATRIMGVHKKRMEDQSMLNILQERLEEKESAINNLIIAMEQGIISATTKERLNNLESEKADIINKIAVEKARASLLIQKEDIVKYLQNAVKKRPLQMIQLIIKQVVLYNDKIEIHLNYTDKKGPDEENRQAFSFYSLTQRVEIDTHKIGRDPIITDYKISLFI